VLKIKNLGFSGQGDQFSPGAQAHVGCKAGLVNLTSFGAGGSDPDGNIVLHEIGEVVLDAIPGAGLHAVISGLVRPSDAIVDQADIGFVSLGVGDFGKLETPGRLFIVVFTQ
jgi:hypothetical protein